MIIILISIIVGFIIGFIVGWALFDWFENNNMDI